MKSSDAWQLAAEFGLPILLVGGAVVGSTLSPARRRWAETYVLLPLFALLALAAGALAAWRQWWWGVAIFAVFFVFAVERLIRRLRDNRRPPNT